MVFINIYQWVMWPLGLCDLRYKHCRLQQEDLEEKLERKPRKPDENAKVTSISACLDLKLGYVLHRSGVPFYESI
jgi:hypothetical protein